MSIWFSLQETEVGPLEINETNLDLDVAVEVWKPHCLWSVQHITKIEFHWYSPGRGTFDPLSIYSLTNTCNWLQGRSFFTAVKTERESETWRGLMIFRFPSHTAHLSHSTSAFFLLFTDSSHAPSLTSTQVWLYFQVCRYEFGKKQNAAAASARRIFSRQTTGVSKPNAYPHPTGPGNTSDPLHLYARAALVINWAGECGPCAHCIVDSSVFYRVCDRMIFWGTRSKNTTHSLILHSLLFKLRYWTFNCTDKTNKDKIHMIKE